jgi:hypothetical protein
MLNPGDMYAVDINQVLWAVGAPKGSHAPRDPEAEDETHAEESLDAVEESSLEAQGSIENAEVDVKSSLEDVEDKESNVEAVAVESEPDFMAERKSTLQELRKFIRDVLARTNPSGSQKQELRAVHKRIAQFLSKLQSITDEDIINIEKDLDGIMDKIEGKTSHKSDAEEDGPQLVSKYRMKRLRRQSEMDAIEGHLKKLSLIPNEKDDSKPYVTPWRPRPYMSPFAFIPRYLEVNHTICSAVYLRHPVAKPGMAEVPTPFPMDMGALAHAWYLRRR